MPTVAIEKEQLFKALGQRFTDDAFRDKCFEYGVELDDITSTAAMIAKGEKAADEVENISADVVYKIDVPANRYDLLCLEGIVRAFRIFLDAEKIPTYVVDKFDPKHGVTITVKKETAAIRPFVVGAVLRGVTFTPESIKSFMDLQDKLHQNIGRRRTLCAIGTHDLDTIKGPFTYEALPQDDIKFVALTEEKSMTVTQLFDTYRKSGNKLKSYLHITENAPRHPVIFDSQKTVLSLPPIINSEHSKIKSTTKNVLIECTGLDLTKLNVVINTMVTMFGQYTSKPFHIEPVQVKYEGADAKNAIYPDLSSRVVPVKVDYINQVIGINPPMEGKRMAEILTKMQLPAVLSERKGELDVSVPPTRSDILHPVDIVEDVAIAYGYNNITKTVPATQTVGRQQPLNKLSDLVRVTVANAGYSEVLTWILCSHDENFAWMNIPDDKQTAVVLANPKTIEFQVCRSSLLPGLLKTLRENNGIVHLPIRLFEVGDAVRLDPNTEVGAKNQRKLSALYCGVTSGFELIHGLVDRVLEQSLYSFVIDPATPEGVKFAAAAAEADRKAAEAKKEAEEKKANADAAEAKKKEKEAKAKAAKLAKKIDGTAAAAPAAEPAPAAAESSKKDKKKGKGDAKAAAAPAASAAPAAAAADTDAKSAKKDKKKGGAAAGAADSKDVKSKPGTAASAAAAAPAKDEDDEDPAKDAEHERLRLKALQKGTYYIRRSVHPSFLAGRSADLFIHRKGEAAAVKIGVFGIVAPAVLNKFNIPYPCSAVEIDLEAFL